MMLRRFRSWHFFYPFIDHPGSDTPRESSGLALNVRGGVAMIEGGGSIRQAIMLLLSTRPGERVMRPEYGCMLHRLLFMPNDATAAGLAIYYVQRALERWEPRIEIIHLDAGQHPQAPEVLSVHLVYRVKTTHEVEQLTVSLNLAGEGL